MLPDWEIANLAQSGMVEPFQLDQVQPSSYDVRLADTIRLARTDWHEVIDLGEPAPDWTQEVGLVGAGYVLRPLEFVLGSTVERLRIPARLCCRVDGKSSLARYGLQIHSAGFVDPGYQGNVTLEIVNFGPRPIRLRARCLIAQLEFVPLTSPARKPYRGRYQYSDGTVDSRYNERVVEIDSARTDQGKDTHNVVSQEPC